MSKSIEVSTFRELKGLSANDVQSYLLANGIKPSAVEAIRKAEIDGESLYALIFPTPPDLQTFPLLKEIGVKLNDFMKIRKLIRGLRTEPGPLEHKSDRKITESDPFHGHVALVIWNNYDGKEGVELRNLREDVKNIKQSLRSLHFDIARWGEDEKLESFFEKLNVFLDRCMRSQDMGTVFVFYYGHGGRCEGQDGMIFDCGTHVSLSIVERKLSVLERRCIPTAIFFNACRVPLVNWTKRFQDPEAKRYIADSKKKGMHVNLTRVLVVYACKPEKRAIYSFTGASSSEEDFKKRINERLGLEFKAGSPFGLIVAQRLRDDESYFALHNTIQAIIDDMNHIGQTVHIPKYDQLKALLPAFLDVPSYRRTEANVKIKITLLSKMPYSHAFQGGFDTLQKQIINLIAFRKKRLRNGECELMKNIQVIPESYDPEDEEDIPETNDLGKRLRWNIVAYYKLAVKQDKEDLIREIKKKLTKYKDTNNTIYCYELTTRSGSLLADINIVLKHGCRDIEDSSFFGEFLTFEINGRTMIPEVSVSRQKFQRWNTAIVLKTAISSIVGLMTLMDAADVTVCGYRFQPCMVISDDQRSDETHPHEVKDTHFDIKLVLQGGDRQMYRKDTKKTIRQITGSESIPYYYGGCSLWASEGFERRMKDKCCVYLFKYTARHFEHWQSIERNFFLQLEQLNMNSSYANKIHAKVLKPNDSRNKVLVVIWHAKGANLGNFIDDLKSGVEDVEVKSQWEESGNLKEVVEVIKTKCPEVSILEDVPRNIQIPPPYVATELGFIEESSNKDEELKRAAGCLFQVVFSCDTNTLKRCMDPYLHRPGYNEYHTKPIPVQQVELVEPKIRDLIKDFEAQRLRQLAQIVSKYLRNYRESAIMSFFEVIIQFIGIRTFEAPTSLPFEDKNSFQYYITDEANNRKMVSKELFQDVPDNAFWKTHIHAEEADLWYFYQEWCIDLGLAERDEETKEVTWPPWKSKKRKVIRLLVAYVLSRDKNTQDSPKPNQTNTGAAQHPEKNKTSETNELPEDNRVVVFDLYILLIHRFGYGDKMIRKARKFYMEEYKDENKSLGLRMVPWYHGVLNDRQVVEIMKVPPGIVG